VSASFIARARRPSSCGSSAGAPGIGSRTNSSGPAPAVESRNPVLGADPANATEQLGVAGPWSERLPHFRSGFAPSSGEEIQSELLVGRTHAADAIEAMRDLSAQIRPLMLVGELRTVAADQLWLSPAYERDTVRCISPGAASPRPCRRPWRHSRRR